MKDLIIVGGGAAGCFAAAIYSAKNPDKEVCILESGSTPLRKVKISGGGRCNVTHACFVPQELVTFYPRGEKELRGPFSRFMTGEVMDWYESRGVQLKIEEDGRVFPVSDNSQSIIDCLLGELEKFGVPILTGKKLTRFRSMDEGWELQCNEELFYTRNILFATGDNKKVWEKMDILGLEIVPPVPSLFTFNIKDKRIEGLQGLSLPEVSLEVKGIKLRSSGPLLITHWGLSGPAVLKLSSIGAREFSALDYQFEIVVNWLGGQTAAEAEEWLLGRKKKEAGKPLRKVRPDGFPTRLWMSLLSNNGIDIETKMASKSFRDVQKIARILTNSIFSVKGKSTFKEEFVTAGGVSLKEIDFRTMQAKSYPGLYFAGEMLDIDAVTGGFNFQAAWTTGWIAANNID